MKRMLVCAALVMGVFISPVGAEEKKVEPGKEISIGGKCTFGGKDSTWSAKLTPKGNNTYDAVYKATWSGKPLDYVGTVKGDLKTEISGEGKAKGGGANGNFEFSGKFGADGVAKCTYKEIGGRRGRSGTLTVDPAK
jgi:hypothetical protein